MAVGFPIKCYHSFMDMYNVSTNSIVTDSKSAMEHFTTWMKAHEDAQVMVASVLVVFGIWWLVRTILSLLINLICPLLVVLVAVLCVPQLRKPLMGENYPVLANTLRNIFLKLAENMKS